jgi:16S rRNA (cytosine1402-N4)-methyltransferase
LGFLNCGTGKSFIDATVGTGGHSKAILTETAPEGIVVGFERDPDAAAQASSELRKFGGRFRLIEENFTSIGKALEVVELGGFNGVVYDLGVSSLQFDTPGRGFSFLKNGPLDMRMDRRHGITAAHVVNTFSEDRLFAILREFGEERFAGRIARNIVKERRKKEIKDTFALKEVIERSVPKKFQHKGIHCATRPFMALRIFVNEELENLKKSLQESLKVLKPRARMAVISFHSLEDRIVKNFFRQGAGTCKCPPGIPVCSCGIKPAIKIVTKKPVLPREEETGLNPRARSAKLRVAEVI